MDALGDFFGMGGYAGFIWPSYAVTAVVLGGLVVASVRSLRAREAELQSLQAAVGSRRAAARSRDLVGEPANDP
ncbi:MAG: heme exporter protein CcmD [Alphaproteobacteria bacterium]